MWIHFIGGEGKGNRLVVMAIGLSSDPEGQMSVLQGVSPFKLTLMGLEDGSPERLETLRKRFNGSKMRGPWYKVSNGLKEYVDALKPVERGKVKPKRVSLALAPSEFQDVTEAVGILGLKTKNRFFRRASRFYIKLARLKAQGWTIQAVKGGQLQQFPDLDDGSDD